MPGFYSIGLKDQKYSDLTKPCLCLLCSLLLKLFNNVWRIGVRRRLLRVAAPRDLDRGTRAWQPVQEAFIPLCSSAFIGGGNILHKPAVEELGLEGIGRLEVGHADGEGVRGVGRRGFREAQEGADHEGDLGLVRGAFSNDGHLHLLG